MAKRRRKASSFPLPFGGRYVKKLVMFLILLVFGAVGGLVLPGKVISVADGDTLTLLTREGTTQRIRLYGVDCPESKQAGGPEAADFTRSLILLEQIEVRTMDTDNYGRSVALVTLPDGRSLNEELVRNGHAWVYTDYCKTPQCLYWKTLEGQARLKQLGLWQQKKPVAPWQWRRRQR